MTTGNPWSLGRSIGGIGKAHGLRHAFDTPEPEPVASAAPELRSRALRLRPPCDILRDVVASAGATFPEKVAPKVAPCFDGKGGAYSMMTSYLGEVVSAEMYGGGYVGQLVLLHANAHGRIAQSSPFDMTTTYKIIQVNCKAKILIPTIHKSTTYEKNPNTIANLIIN